MLIYHCIHLLNCTKLKKTEHFLMTKYQWQLVKRWGETVILGKKKKKVLLLFNYKVKIAALYIIFNALDFFFFSRN